MKGYRKLQVGEVIREGDGFFLNNGFIAYDAYCFKHKLLHDDPPSFRPIQKKVKAFDLHAHVLDIVASGGTLSDRAGKLVRFIRRNYRRKE